MGQRSTATRAFTTSGAGRDRCEHARVRAPGLARNVAAGVSYLAQTSSSEGLMAQLPVEMILVRQLAGYLYVPVLVVDTTGTVVFYNEPAERILGVRFEETGRIDPKEVDRLIELSDDPAADAEDAVRPVIAALQDRRPVHVRRSLLRRGDRVRLQVEITAFPLIDQDDRLLGAVAMFWERQGP